MPIFSPLSLNTNVTALSAQSSLQRSSSRLSTSLERLSTGLRINRSSDDPSGLVISEFQRSQISGLDKAVSNVDRAISLVQTAEGGLAEISSLLLDLRSLVTDSANNGALDLPSLEANQANVTNILNTIDRIANTTTFGTFKLLNGDSGVQGTTTDSDITFLAATDPSVVPANNAPFAIDISQRAERAFVTVDQTAGSAGGLTAAGQLANDETLIINGVEIELEGDLSTGGNGLTQAQVIERINEFTGQTGVVAFRDLTGATHADVISLRTVEFGSQASINVVSTQAAGATQTGLTNFSDTGVDLAGTIGGAAATGHGNVLTGAPGSIAAGISVLVGTDATFPHLTVGEGAASGNAPAPPPAAAGPPPVIAASIQGDLVLFDGSRSFQIGAFADADLNNPQNRATITIDKADTSALGIGIIGNNFANLSQIDVRSVEGANDALAVIEQSIAEVANERGKIGAFQKNTLESTQSNLRSQLINLQDAESSLRDTDFTEEITRFTQEQIRQQTATTVLGLANQSALAILGLLQSGGG